MTEGVPVTADPTFWNKIAEDYARKPVEDPAAFERKIEVMKSHLAPTHTALDIGCGTGSLALRLAPFAAQVHGLDVSPAMVAIARRKAAAAGTQNVTFHAGAFDAGFTALPQGVDLLCACSLLHLVDDRAAVLAQALRLLVPGGTFVASTVCLGESWVPWAPLLTAARWAGKAPPVWILSKQQLADEVRRAGFVDLSFPDVGAAAQISFLVAKRPLTT
jgi:arsenite methyltransferase